MSVRFPCLKFVPVRPWTPTTDSKLGAVTLRENTSNIMMHIRFLFQDITDSFFRGDSPRYFNMILYVFVDTRAKRGQIRCSSFEARLSACALCAQNTARG